MESLKQHLFDRRLNPAIKFLSDKSLWVTQNIPDFSTSNTVRVIGFLYAIFLLGWLIMEGISIFGIITRGLLMALFIGVVYAKFISCLVWVVIFKWETFK